MNYAKKKTSTIRIKGGRRNDFLKIFNVLKKLEVHFRNNPTLMNMCSQMLLKENLQRTDKNYDYSKVCNWVLRQLGLLINVSDAKGLLHFAKLTMNGQGSRVDCDSLLPPSQTNYDAWYHRLYELSGKMNPKDREVSRQDHLIRGKSVKVLPPLSVDTAMIDDFKGNYDESGKNLLPPLAALPRGVIEQHQSKKRLKIKKSSSNLHALVPSPNDLDVVSNSSPNKNRSPSKNRNQKPNSPLKLADLVVLARKKQHFERLERSYQQEQSRAVNGIDYGLLRDTEKRISKKLPSFQKPITFNEKVDMALFGENSLAQINEHGLFRSPNTKMKKQKPRFMEESKMVKNEVYKVLGVTADTTIRMRKY